MRINPSANSIRRHISQRSTVRLRGGGERFCRYDPLLNRSPHGMGNDDIEATVGLKRFRRSASAMATDATNR